LPDFGKQKLPSFIFSLLLCGDLNSACAVNCNPSTESLTSETDSRNSETDSRNPETESLTPETESANPSSIPSVHLDCPAELLVMAGFSPLLITAYNLLSTQSLAISQDISSRRITIATIAHDQLNFRVVSIIHSFFSSIPIALSCTANLYCPSFFSLSPPFSLL
jgi:hypothetical protein